MKNNSIYKKIACALVLANIITMLGVTGCDTNEDPVNTGATGTPESTEAPFTSTDELFGAGDKDYLSIFTSLKGKLFVSLKETGDSRLGDNPEIWESYPRLSGPMRNFPI